MNSEWRVTIKTSPNVFNEQLELFAFFNNLRQRQKGLSGENKNFH